MSTSTQNKGQHPQNDDLKSRINYIPMEKGIEIGNRVIEKYKEALQELAKR